MRFRLRSKPDTYAATVEMFDECLAQLSIKGPTPRHYLLPLTNEGGGAEGDARGHSESNCDSSTFRLRFHHYALSTHHAWTDDYRAKLFAERAAALEAGETIVIRDMTDHAGG